MRTLLLLPLLLASATRAQEAAAPGGGSSLEVLGSKWSSSRKAVAGRESGGPAPAATVTRNDRVNERNRTSDPTGLRFPEPENADARSAAIERNVRAARTPPPKTVEGFEYRVRVRNAAAKAVEVVFWEYQFTETANPANVARRQFLCGVAIKPGKEKELQAFSHAGPSAVVGAASLANKSGDLFAGKVTINRVEYADGTIWQRKGWSYAEVRAAIASAVAAPWGAEMCRPL